MPNTLSSKKRVRQNEKRRLRNRSLRSELKTEIKKFTACGDAVSMAEELPRSFRALDRAVKQGIIHRNAADRKKSRLAQRVEKVKADEGSGTSD